MDEKVLREFKEGIFALRTRRFGTVAEIMISELLNMGQSHNLAFDLQDLHTREKVEVKFSTVMRKNEDVIKPTNVISQCIQGNLGNRMMKSTEATTQPFDCNIQKVKRTEFDVLYYGLFFEDRIAIFRMRSSDILQCEGYSDFQHRGNEGEGQFHINNATYQYHMNHWFVQWLSYEELYELFATNA